jgi:hypothetical protein
MLLLIQPGVDLHVFVTPADPFDFPKRLFAALSFQIVNSVNENNHVKRRIWEWQGIRSSLYHAQPDIWKRVGKRVA